MTIETMPGYFSHDMEDWLANCPDPALSTIIRDLYFSVFSIRRRLDRHDDLLALLSTNKPREGRLL